MKETHYKIRHKSSGRFSSGGTSPSFTKNGKTWRTLGHLKQHLKIVGRNRAYAECELVVLTREVVETEEIQSLEDFIDSLSAVEKKRREEERKRTETREKNERRKAYEKLRKEFEEEYA